MRDFYSAGLGVRALRVVAGLGARPATIALLLIGLLGSERREACAQLRGDAELLGVPVGMSTVVELLPSQDGGHSMLQLAQVLRKIGLHSEGRRASFDMLLEGAFPCIAHMDEPDHFVVVSAAEGDRVDLYNGLGRRETWPAERFQAQWSGHVLYVGRKGRERVLPAFRKTGPQSGPQIQFDTLLIDKGDVPAVGEPIEFKFRFANWGNRELIIETVQPDCKCLSFEKPEEAIPPGGEGVISLTYHVRPHKGAFQHEALVQTNDPRLPAVVLKAAGNTDVGVKVSPGRLDLGEIVVGQPRSSACFLHCAGDWKDFSIRKVEASLAVLTCEHYSTENMDRARCWFPQAAADLNVSPGTRVVEFIFSPARDLLGKVQSTVWLRSEVRDPDMAPGFPGVSHVLRGRLRQKL